MQLPGLGCAAFEEVSEVLVLVAGFVENVGALGGLEAKGAIVLHADNVVQAHCAALLGKGGQLVDQQRELDEQIVVRIAEQSDNAEERLGDLRLLLEALEDAADVELLRLSGLRAFAF